MTTVFSSLAIVFVLLVRHHGASFAKTSPGPERRPLEVGVRRQGGQHSALDPGGDCDQRLVHGRAAAEAALLPHDEGR
jgi:hypothetical protein